MVAIRADSADALRRELVRHGIRLLYTYTVPDESPQGRVLAEAVRQGWLRKHNRDAYFVRSKG